MLAILKSIRESLRFLYPRFWVIEGIEKRSGYPLSVIWCGPGRQRALISGRVFGDGQTNMRCIGRHLPGRLDSLRRKQDCTLSFIAAHRDTLSRYAREGDYLVPWWIDSESDIDAENGVVQTGPVKRLLRSIRSNEFSYVVDNSAATFRFFHEKMYLPTITASHGAAALPSSVNGRLSQLSAGKIELLLIKMAGKPVAGIVLDYRSETPALRDIGVIGADMGLQKKGAIGAAYVFSFKYLASKGFAKASLGQSRCFLDDGILNFKQKWRPVLTEPSCECFLLSVFKLDEASRSVLRTSSFISGDTDDLQFVFFSASEADEQDNVAKRERLSSIYKVTKALSVDVSGKIPSLQTME
jgi:hypothetical protein